MNKRSVLLAGFIGLLALSPLRAGIELGMDLEHGTVMRFESVMVRVRVDNDTDYAFTVDSRQSNQVNDIWIEIQSERMGEREELRVPALRYLYLLPDEGQEFRFDLARFVDLSRLGGYFVRVAARSSSGVVQSPLRRFEVVRGYELVKKSRTVPGYAELMRSYSLLYWAREGREYLFLSVDEPGENVNLGVFNLGPLIRVEPPELSVGRDGTVTVVHQSAYRRYTRTVLKSKRDSVEMLDQRYLLPDGSPFPKPGERKPLKLKEPEKRWWEFWK